MKLIIQIPCLNESASLPATVAALPRKLDGFSVVEFLVVDDGSTDGTSSVARSLGVDHVIIMDGHQGLAHAFMAGVNAAVARGADVLVNTDADNQYSADDLAALVRPVLDGRADMAIGERPILSMEHFSLAKRILQRVGSGAVRAVSGADIRDAPSGFRAISRNAALKLSVFGSFTYTIETVIQAGLNDMRVINVPVRVNAPMRPSRLFRSNIGYVVRSVATMFATYVTYRPAMIFSVLGTAFILPGVLIGCRYLTLMAFGEGRGHVQSVIASASLLLGGLFMACVGIIAHLQGINRRLLEEIRLNQRSAFPGLFSPYADPRKPLTQEQSDCLIPHLYDQHIHDEQNL